MLLGWFPNEMVECSTGQNFGFSKSSPLHLHKEMTVAYPLLPDVRCVAVWSPPAAVVREVVSLAVCAAFSGGEWGSPVLACSGLAVPAHGAGGVAPPFLSPQNVGHDPVDFCLDSKGSLNSLLGLKTKSRNIFLSSHKST